MRFYIPLLAAHSGWKSAFGIDRASRYHFHVPNTIDGEFTNLASHELDVAFILQNYFDHLDESSRRVATQMTDQWIAFTNGEPWCEVGKLVVIGADGLVKVEEREYDAAYRAGSAKLLMGLGPDRLWRVAEAWQGVRAEQREDVARGKL